MGRNRSPDPQRNNQFTADRNAGRGKGAPRASFALTDDEHAALRRYLKQYGVTLSELVRGRLADALGTVGHGVHQVHYLRAGEALCGLGKPVTFPPFHLHSREHQHVTCGSCASLIQAGHHMLRGG